MANGGSGFSSGFGDSGGSDDDPESDDDSSEDEEDFRYLFGTDGEHTLSALVA